MLPYRWNVNLLSIDDLRCPIEPRNVCLGRQPAGGINRLSHPRSVLEAIYTGRHNGAINIDIDLCRGRRLRRRAFGCLPLEASPDPGSTNEPEPSVRSNDTPPAPPPRFAIAKPLAIAMTTSIAITTAL